MKKLFTLLMLGATMSVSAQHLPNVGFDNWKGSGKAGSTYQSSRSGMTGSSNAGFRQRPGDEPVDWFGSSINQKVMNIEKKQELVYSVLEEGNTWAKLVNTFVGISSFGSNAPAYLTFGTPWVYAISDVSKCDGGTFGGVSFSTKPDAIVGKYKKTSVATTENSYIVAYIWNGTFKSQIVSTSTADADKIKEDVDRAILGSQAGTGFESPSVVSQKGNLIAYCNKQFVSTKNNDWETIEVPMTYIEANKSLVPEKMNVVICAGDYKTRGNIQNGTTLEVDDVDFVYWNTLSSLKYDGNELLEGETTSYSVDAEYDAAKLVATAKSQFASVSTSYDEVTAVATVTVTRENAENKTYTIQFAVPSSELDMAATKYNGSAIAFVDGSATVDALYDESLLNLVPVHSSASVENSYDEETAVLTVTVKAANFAKDATNKHVYTIQFKKPVKEIEIPMVIGAKYGTFCAPFEVTEMPVFGYGEAYTVDGLKDDGTTLCLTTLSSIPAHTPVIIYCEFRETNSEVRKGLPTEGTPKAGLLTGTYEDIKAPKGSYVLQKQGEKVGFYKVEDVQPTVKAYRAYLNVDSNVKGFGFSTENGATAIKALEALTSGKPEIYDLNGRKLNKLQKGVNIVNGVKVLVK